MLTMTVDYEQKYSMRDDCALRVCGIATVNAQSGWAFSAHRHDDATELILVVKGRGKLHYNHETFETRAGDLLIINAGVLHEEEAHSDDPLNHVAVQLTGIKLDGMRCNCIMPDNAVPVLKTGCSFDLLHQLFVFVQTQCIDKNEGYEIVLHDLARSVLSIITQLLLKEHCILEPRESSFPAIREITHYLDHHYFEPITLEKLSKQFHFSTFYLARKFKDETGYTINQYIANRRMGEAERLLVYEDLSIKEIALRCGFQNLNYFYNTFKKYTGCSPSQFREMYCQ